jgi:hypothetical protein
MVGNPLIRLLQSNRYIRAGGLLFGVAVTLFVNNYAYASPLLITVPIETNGTLEATNISGILGATTTKYAGYYTTDGSSWTRFNTDINYATDPTASFDIDVFSIPTTSTKVHWIWQPNSVNIASVCGTGTSGHNNCINSSTTYGYTQYNASTTWSYITGFSSEFPLTEDYIYLSVNSNPNNVGYSTTISGYLNNYQPSSPITTYSITFLSQTGIDYTETNIVASTTATGVVQFSHPVTFSMDDIVYVRAYLYDSNNQNAVNLIDISQEYEFWVSANANPTQTVDLGTFRTSALGCDPNATSTLSATLCRVGFALFVPSDSSVQLLQNSFATVTSTAPFSYIHDVRTYIDELFTVSTTSWTITVGSSSPYIGDITILSSSDVDNSANYQLIRNAFTMFIYLSAIMYVYMRSKSFARSL